MKVMEHEGFVSGLQGKIETPKAPTQAEITKKKLDILKEN